MSRGAFIAALAVAAISSQGCVPEYVTRFEKSYERLKVESERREKFDQLLDAKETVLGESLFRLRLGKGMEDVRVERPVWLPRPQFQLNYSANAKVGEEESYQYSCLVYTGKGKKEDVEKIASDLLKAAKAKFPGAAEWEEVELESPTGGRASWRRLLAAGKDTFYYSPSEGETTAPNLEGKFALYLHEKGEDHLLLVWKAPDAIAEKVNLGELADVMAGSVVISAPESSAEDNSGEAESSGDGASS